MSRIAYAASKKDFIYDQYKSMLYRKLLAVLYIP